jgi:hypothetical protein
MLCGKNNLKMRFAWFSAVLLASVALPSANAAVYQYVGSPFRVCGFGCAQNAPEDWSSDYIVASISFAAPLQPDLTLSDDVFSTLTAWTLGDALGYASFSSTSATLTGIPWEGIPSLTLSTDSAGNIVNWIMATHVAPNIIGIANPPFQCKACGPTELIADILNVNYGPDLGNDSVEWDVATNTPGRWTELSAVPEPSTLLLTSLSGIFVIIGVRRRRKLSS